MKLDYKLQDIFHEISREIKEELDIDISIQELAEIADSQFQVAIYAMTKGYNVSLHKFGTLKRKFLNEIRADKARLAEYKKTHTEEEYIKKKTEYKINYKEKRKEINLKQEKPTLEELLKAEAIVKINSKFSKFNV